jgi:hypothetical protein
VELVTAASLMTVLMLGVVQIFGIITTTATEAEGIHFAHQQGRALFNQLRNDLRGMSREGYLQITNTLKTDPQGTGQYRADTLAFVTVGSCISSGWSGNPYDGAVSEVVYTTNVLTDQTLWRINAAAGEVAVYPRKGVLGRGQWILSATEDAGAAADLDDRSGAAYLFEMFSDQPPSNPKGLDRKAKQSGPQLRIWPWLTEAAVSAHPESLRRVQGSCASEFFVEAFNVKPTTTNDNWKSVTKDWRWSTKPTTTTGTPDRLEVHWPTAVRVTVAFHDPADNSAVKANQRIRGVAMQETFWISDP